MSQPAEITSETVGATNWRQFAFITAGAIAVFVGLRLLPTGTNLNHMDFRATGGNTIEFCDPLNPQFISVVAARSPVTMSVAPDPRGTVRTVAAGTEIAVIARLHTGSGKPIAPADLLVTHTRPLHLLVIDPTLADYQHVHPTPGTTPGEWTFSFTPKMGGDYRVFADFTPAATARGLYASADLLVNAATPAQVPASTAAPVAVVERDGFRFSIRSTPQPVRGGQPADLEFAIVRLDGGPVPMQPVMGAFAHLVAFDQTRSGFAHLHPVEIDPLSPPDSVRPKLNFKLTIPQPGRYAIWAQVNLDGQEVFVPFWIEVATSSGN